MGIMDVKIMLVYRPFGMCLLSDMELMEVRDIVANNGGLGMYHAEDGSAVGCVKDKWDSEGRCTEARFLEARPGIIEAETVLNKHTCRSCSLPGFTLFTILPERRCLVRIPPGFAVFVPKRVPSALDRLLIWW